MPRGPVVADGQRCPTHGAWHETGTLCPLCVSQMNGNIQSQAPLGELPRAGEAPAATKAAEGVPMGANRAGDGFGSNDTAEAPKPKRDDGKKKIGPEDRVWFGKHKGAIAKSVDPSYWSWANENLAWLAVSPELLKNAERRDTNGSKIINRDTELWFGKYSGRPACLCPADYIVWLSENTNFSIEMDFLEDCRVDMGRP